MSYKDLQDNCSYCLLLLLTNVLTLSGLVTSQTNPTLRSNTTIRKTSLELNLPNTTKLVLNSAHQQLVDPQIIKLIVLLLRSVIPPQIDLGSEKDLISTSSDCCKTRQWHSKKYNIYIYKTELQIVRITEQYWTQDRSLRTPVYLFKWQ